MISPVVSIVYWCLILDKAGNEFVTYRAPVQYLIQNHLPTHDFLPIITRDTPDLLPKPDPAGILFIAQQWGLTDGASSLIMVSCR